MIKETRIEKKHFTYFLCKKKEEHILVFDIFCPVPNCQITL